MEIGGRGKGKAAKERTPEITSRKKSCSKKSSSPECCLHVGPCGTLRGCAGNALLDSCPLQSNGCTWSFPSTHDCHLMQALHGSVRDEHGLAVNLSYKGRDTQVTKAGSAGGRTPPAFGGRWRLKTPCPSRMGSVLRIRTCRMGWDICIRKDVFTQQILPFVLQWYQASILGKSTHPKCPILLCPFIYKASSLQATPQCHLPTLCLPKIHLLLQKQTAWV